MYKNFKPKNSYLDVRAEQPKGGKASEGKTNSMLSFIAMKDLPHSSYGIKADPYQEANEVATAYPLLNQFNRNIGASYSGEKNLASGNLPQYVNSYKSGFLNAVDAIAMRVKLNYRYLPIWDNDTTRGAGLVDKAKNSIAEAISLLGATTYTELTINNYYVVTTMPMGTDYGEGRMGHPSRIEEDTGAKVYTHPVDVLYAILIYYQLYLQNINGVMSQLNKFRACQGEMMRMSWERETPTLNDLFSIANKKSFLSKADSLSLIIEGEYFDSEWQTQANMITNLVSRKSEAIVDPLKEVIGYHHMPSIFRMGIKNEDGTDNTSAIVFNSDSLVSGTDTFISVIDDWSEHLSANFVLAWARRLGIGVEDANSIGFYNDYLIKPLNLLTGWSNVFKTSFNDLRVALDTLQRTGVITWAKGYRPKVISSTNVPVYNNTIVNDIYSSTMGGSDVITFNNTTKRWRNFSLWNMYNGIPQYDEFQGGAFLAISTKNPIVTQDDDGNVDYLPKAFSVDNLGVKGIVVAIDRTGTVYQIGYDLVTMASDDRTARLVPLLSQASHRLRVPTLKASAPELTPTDVSKTSWLIRTLTKAFGVAADNSFDALNVDPDIIAVYDYEIEDLTNDAIAYIKQHGPFRGSRDASSSLGFFGLQK